MAPSQNVFLAAASQRTQRLRFGPGVYVLPLHHPLRLIEEISMLDNLSGGRMEIGVGRGGVLEAYFWGQDSDPETNAARYEETLEVIRRGLANDVLTSTAASTTSRRCRCGCGRSRRRIRRSGTCATRRPRPQGA